MANSFALTCFYSIFLRDAREVRSGVASGHPNANIQAGALHVYLSKAATMTEQNDREISQEAERLYLARALERQGAETRVYEIITGRNSCAQRHVPSGTWLTSLGSPRVCAAVSFFENLLDCPPVLSPALCDPQLDGHEKLQGPE